MSLFQRRLAGLLSFLMPGLGQLFLGNSGATVFFFVGFVVLLSTPSFFIFLPAWGLFSSLHAYRWPRFKESKVKDPTWRNFCYCVVGFVGFFGWMMLFSPSVLPFRITLNMNSRVNQIMRDVRDFKQKHHRYPSSMQELKLDGARARPFYLDAWGREFELRSEKEPFELRSWGRDGKPDTKDDFVYPFR